MLTWDLPVRLFHWTLVVAVLAAFVTNKLGIAYFKYHVWCGYTVIVLIAFRIIWGIIGTYHARFWNFVRSPWRTFSYTRDWLRHREQPHAGHNPLGAWMVLLLLLTLFLQALLGLFGNDEIFNLGPLYGYVSNERSLQLTSIHRQLAYWILAAVVVHVIAVIAHRVFKKENLVKPMITGYKDHDATNSSVGINTSRTWLAIVLVAVLSGTLAWIINHTPVATLDAGF